VEIPIGLLKGRGKAPHDFAIYVGAQSPESSPDTLKEEKMKVLLNGKIYDISIAI
jgi:hypothetical protein